MHISNLNSEKHLISNFDFDSMYAELQSGKRARLLVGFASLGPKARNYSVLAIDANFRYPQDYNYFIQNVCLHISCLYISSFICIIWLISQSQRFLCIWPYSIQHASTGLQSRPATTPLSNTRSMYTNHSAVARSASPSQFITHFWYERFCFLLLNATLYCTVHS